MLLDKESYIYTGKSNLCNIHHLNKDFYKCHTWRNIDVIYRYLISYFMFETRDRWKDYIDPKVECHS